MKRKISSMNDEEFSKYINAAKNADNTPQQTDDVSGANTGDENLEALFAAAAKFYGTSDRAELAALIARDLNAPESENEYPTGFDMPQGGAGYGVQQFNAGYGMQPNSMSYGMGYGMQPDGMGFGIQDGASYSQRIGDIQNDWVRQSNALKQIIPDFDLEEAFANPDFYRAVVEEHKTLAEAYPLLTKKQQPRRAISEVGNLSNGVAGNIKHDVKTMSDKEFEEYIRKIKNS